MAYGIVDDMVAAFGEAEIIRISTPQGADRTGIDVDRVNGALADASDLIDSHLRRRYACPLAVTPPAVKRACLVLARYDLSFGGDIEPSEQTRLARKETIEWLGHLNSGSVSLEGVELSSNVIGARTIDRRSRVPGGAYGVGPGPRFQPSLSGLGLGYGYDLW